jgi:hypothetical protein
MLGIPSPESNTERLERSKRHRSVFERLVPGFDAEGSPLTVHDEADLIITLVGHLLERIEVLERDIDIENILSMNARVSSLERLMARVAHDGAISDACIDNE